MIGRQREFFLSVTFLIDLGLVALAWLAAWPIRFLSGLVPLYIPHIPSFGEYAWYAVLVLLIWAVVLRSGRLYQEKTVPSLFQEISRLLQGHAISFLIFVLLTFFLAQYKPSRVVFGIFFILSTFLIVSNHLAVRTITIRRFRKGLGVRRVLIVGSGDPAIEVARKIKRHRELGLQIIGFLSDDEPRPATLLDFAVFGGSADVERIIAEQRIDSVFIAFPLNAVDRMRQVLEAIGEEMVDVKVVPDLYQYVTLRAGVEEFEGLPIISLKDTPLYGWKAVGKRAFDVFVTGAALVALSPVLIVIAILVKLTSPGPVFYRQERMGLDGRTFGMFKFRSMRQDAEKTTGAVWAVKDDPRRTRFGTFIRKTSLDELPQLINVLAGHMSLVGPRPERPVFIQEFRTKIPRYMLRHKVKAGITGWAQANGWRGNTDLTRRIECDIYYIENWSFWLDLRIIWMTLVRGFVDKNAY